MFKVIGKYALAIAAFSAVGAVSLGSNAQAAEQSAGVPTVTVRYADLNLNTAEGVEALYARLQAAAKKACSQHEGRALIDVVEWRTCYTQALEKAVSNVKSEHLSVLHRESARETLS
jgi:UrcA family protein